MHLSAIRAPDGVRAPLDLRRAIAGNAKTRGKMVVHANERSLLNFVAIKLHKMDPDVLLGHNILGFSLDVLLHRMAANKVPAWSKIGRLRRTRFPKMKQMGMGGVPASATAGRLVCDTYSGAKELIRQTSYSLSALAGRLLKFKRVDIQPLNVPDYFQTSAQVMQLAGHTETDAFLTIRLMKHLELLPLTKQLTELAGNRWARSLRGARAERIEYLLLHEFDRLDYVVPDKHRPKNGQGGKRRGKPAYAGGLVLEPKKGLYDSFILMLDFNSLYPSIIQEFNICFTTVERKKSGHSALVEAELEEANLVDLDDEDDAAEGAAAGGGVGTIEIPPVPASSCAPGVLPRVIKVLIDRRTQVKQMIKTETDAERKKMLDVRQKALKIMANSMCVPPFLAQNRAVFPSCFRSPPPCIAESGSRAASVSRLTRALSRSDLCPLFRSPQVRLPRLQALALLRAADRSARYVAGARDPPEHGGPLQRSGLRSRLRRHRFRHDQHADYVGGRHRRGL